MKQGPFTVVRQSVLTDSVRELVLSGDTSACVAPGQFAELSLPGFFLRRPISLCDWDAQTLTLVYKIVGSGTAALADVKAGDTLDVLTGLGNGYDLTRAGEHPLLLGGGVGIPPLCALAKTLRAQGRDVSVLLGFNTAEDVFYEDVFRRMGCRVSVTTADGSCGARGFVTDALPQTYSFFYACGPLPMLKAVYKKTQTAGQFSLEERMGCGFGACMGCSIRTRAGAKRVCKDGPVFDKEVLLWDD